MHSEEDCVTITNRGFARQPRCMAGTMKIFCIKKNLFSHTKSNLLYLPSSMAASKTSIAAVYEACTCICVEHSLVYFDWPLKLSRTRRENFAWRDNVFALSFHLQIVVISHCQSFDFDFATLKLGQLLSIKSLLFLLPYNTKILLLVPASSVTIASRCVCLKRTESPPCNLYIDEVLHRLFPEQKHKWSDQSRSFITRLLVSELRL